MTIDSTNSARVEGRTLRSRGAWAVLLVTLAIALALDLWSKWYAFERVAGSPVATTRAEVLQTGPKDLWRLIPPHDPVVVVPRGLHFTLVYNPGAVFGIGAGQRWFFVAFTGVAMVFGLWMFASWTRPRDHAAHAGIGLILSGGLGNLYDRLLYGCVRDFIHPLPGVKLPFGWAWPGGERDVWPWVSNLADLFLIIGVGMLVVISLRGGGREKPVTS